MSDRVLVESPAVALPVQSVSPSRQTRTMGSIAELNFTRSLSIEAVNGSTYRLTSRRCQYTMEDLFIAVITLIIIIFIRINILIIFY